MNITDLAAIVSMLTEVCSLLLQVYSHIKKKKD